MRRLKYPGYAWRNPRTDLMLIVLNGKEEGKRGRGRLANTYIENIKKDSRLSKIKRGSEDYDDWPYGGKSW